MEAEGGGPNGKIRSGDQGGKEAGGEVGGKVAGLNDTVFSETGSNSEVWINWYISVNNQSFTIFSYHSHFQFQPPHVLQHVFTLTLYPLVRTQAR